MAFLGNLLAGRGLRPLARDDNYTLSEDEQALIVRPQQNDSANHPLFPNQKIITSVTAGDYLGSVSIINNGNYLQFSNGTAYDYLSDGETATARLTYTVRNAWGEWHHAEINLTIEGANDAPDVFGVDAAASESGPQITIATSFFDPDANDSHTITFDASATTGVVSDNGDGTFSYDPAGQFESLSAGQTTTDSFTYTVTDSNGASGTASIVITITGENDNPVANPISAAAGEDDATLLLTVDFSDVDANDNHTFSIDDSATTGLIADNGDGTFSYSPNGQFEHLAAGETATDSFTYTVDDGQGGMATAIASIVITGVNDAPGIQDTTVSFTEDDGPFDFSMGIADVDNTIADLMLFGAIPNGIDPIFGPGTLSLNPDGTIHFDYVSAQPNLFQRLSQGETETITTTIGVSDGAIGEIAHLTFLVTGQNDAPIANALAASLTEDDSSVLLSADFSDVDANDNHTISLDDSGISGAVTDNGDGTFSYSPNGQFEHLAAGETATDSFTYTVDDGNGGTSTATATVTITGVNDAPVAQNISRTVNEDRAFPDAPMQFVIPFTDADANDTHSFSILTVPNGATALISDGTVEYYPFSQFEFLAVGQTQNVTMVYEVTDGQGASDTGTAIITVTGENDTPTLSVLDRAVQVEENTNAVSFSHTANDVDDGDTFTWSIVGGSDASRFDINPLTGALAFRDAPDFEAPTDGNGDNIYEVGIAITDNHGATSVPTALRVQVTDVQETVFENLVIDFEDRAGQQPLGDQPGDVYEGFVWQSSGSGYSDIDYEPDGDTEMLGFSNTMVIKRLDGTDFDFNQFELGAGASRGSSFGNASSFTIVGKQGGGTKFSQTFNAGVDFDNTSLLLFQPGFEGIDQLEIMSNGFYAVDNFVFEVQPTSGNTAPGFLADDMIMVPELETAVPDYSPTITDPDVNDGHTFQIAGGADAAAFSINSTTGALTFRSIPDFEAPADSNGDNIYVVHLTVTDLSGAVSNAEHLRVHVTDVDPEPAIPQPLVLDFEDLGGQVLGTNQPNYQGFTWQTNSGFGADDWDLDGDAEITGGINEFSFERTDGTDFDFDSFDLGQGFVAGDGFAAASFVTVTGQSNGATVASQTFLAGTDFNNFSMTPQNLGFVGVDRVILQTDGFYALDNMSFEVLI